MLKTLRLLEDILTKCGKETIDWDTVFKVYEIKEIINSSSKTRLGSLSALSTTNCLSELWCWNQFQKCIKIALKMQMKCRKYPCEEKISKNVLETNLKKKNEILEILSEKDILEITIKNAEIFFTYNT